MSHIEDAKASTNLVVKLLVNRFGSQEEVFRHLTDVLRHLEEAEAEFARLTAQLDEAKEPVAAVEEEEEEPESLQVDTTEVSAAEIAENVPTIPGPAEAPDSEPEPKPARKTRRSRKAR